MKITASFIDRLVAMTPYERGRFFQEHKTEIDFTALITRAKERLIEITEPITKTEKTDAENNWVVKQQENIEEIIDDSVLYAAAELHPGAVEGPFLVEKDLRSNPSEISAGKYQDRIFR